MDAQDFWYSSGAAGGGGGDQGEDIGNSLRFGGAESLRRTFTQTGNRRRFTISCWVKFPALGNFKLLNIGTDGNNCNTWLFQNADGQQAYEEVNGGSHTTFGLSTARFRDPTAWYHLVFVADTANATANERIRIFVNGEIVDMVQQAGTWPVNQNYDFDFNTNVIHSIGAYTGGTAFGQAYLAQYYFVDGQALQPTSFGRQNAEGVWVPITPDLDPVQIWSNDLTSAAGFNAGNPATLAFDGVDNTFAECPLGNNSMTWTPTGGFDFTGNLLVRTLRNGNRARLNGGAWVNLTANANTTIATGGGTVTTLEIEQTLGATGACSLATIFASGARVDDTNGDYGVNGFHLDFSDPTFIGRDSSGNGNNFTNHGFNFDTVGVFSNQTTATPGGFRASDPATRMFDGNLSTRALADQSDAIITFEPNPALAFTNGVHMNVNHTTASPGEFRVTVDGTTGAWTTFPNPNNSTAGLVNTVATGAGSLERIEVRRTDDQLPAVIAIGLNGTAAANILVDNTGEDYDHMTDSPTQNFATGNPLQSVNGGSEFNGLRDANLVSTGFNSSALPPSFSTIKIEAGQRYYVEWQSLPGAGTSNVGVSYRRLENAEMQQWKKDGALNWFCDTRNQLTFDNTSPANNSPGNYLDGGVASFEINATVNPFTVTARLNGANAITQALDGGQDAFDADEVYFFTNTQFSTDGRLAFNFGQQPFINQPANTVPLQTQNLPTPDILNGRDHFNCSIWTGQNNERNITTGFSPGLVWIKKRSGGDARSHLLFDNVRGARNGITTDTEAAESDFSGGVTAFNNDNYTIGNSDFVNGTNANNYVGWCWRAGGAAVTNNDGSLESQVSANTDSGFSIVTYTGNGANAAATIGHGLNQAPEFMILAFRNSAGQKTVYHEALGATARLRLNEDSGLDTSTSHWNDTPPTNTVFTVGNNFNQNTVFNYVTYCWHSVPGFSSIGTYVGNGAANDNGPFVYCGFRPAWVMTRRIAGSHWSIWDSTQVPTNPVNFSLQADQTGNSNNRIDILSNGFKIRNAAQVSSTDGSEYIYCAFAENPFGGQNTAPANAR